MKISPARTAAFDVLLRIEIERAFSSVLLPMFEADLSPVDRALCHELTLGTLRRQMYLDRVIDTFAGGKKIDLAVRIALRLALYQLYNLDKVPHYSAINESVNLVQRAKKTSAKGFANAILRRASREHPDLSFVDEIERLSVESSHPRWLIEKWIGYLGFDETVRLAAANNEIAETAFRVIGGLSDEGQKVIEASRPSVFVEGCYLAEKGEQRIFELAERGEIYLQDETSQMVAQTLEIPRDGYFLDVCAAPGGKTGLIAVRSPAARLVAAGDIHGPRVEFLKENCRRQGAAFAQILQYNAQGSLPFAHEAFDCVFVDAPCSGTGTIRRNPEIRYFLKPEDLNELAAKQLSILTNASKLVRSGGTIIYSTCSLETEENESVCKPFLMGNLEFQSVLPNLAAKFVTETGFARTWPQRDNMDGFFIAEFRRT
ncbi:MAG: 16S rRNA (cytosine(967)-C(5))-methyltransferase RsmB [Pyrinomonadaceae bacterium]